jgi:S-adenosylmethionine hydrolase
LTVCPDATLVDIGHDIPAHDVMAGALELAACYRYFPHGTIFLVVVDPGVGSSRRGIAADIGDYKFVAPDNGVLSAVFLEAPPKKVVELTERKYALPTVSRTFEGRDRFAPAAGFLAKGVALVSLGKAIKTFHSIDLPRPVVEARELTGQVLRVDRFGNLITNIDRHAFEQFAAGQAIAVQVGGRDIPRIVATYAEAPAGELCALFGSTDHLEVAVNAGDAAAMLGLARGAVAAIRIVS